MNNALQLAAAAVALSLVSAHTGLDEILTKKKCADRKVWNWLHDYS